MMHTTILTGNSRIYVGEDVLAGIEKYFSGRRDHRGEKIFILVDDHTRKACLPMLQKQVASLNGAQVLEIEHGESAKRIETIVSLWQTLTDAGADRKSVLVNLGGGVISDIGGFVASTYMRGIRFMNIPTTLLAMVDASVGGKNGINFGGYKNQVGTFDEPVAVYVNPEFLNTLPAAEMCSGFAEVIKHALISGNSHWEKIAGIRTLASVNWIEIIQESIHTKNKIVSSDFRDQHIRKSLNFGHTIGHALESYFQDHEDSPLKHGEAVAIGMLGELFLSRKLCGLDSKVTEAASSFISIHFPQPQDFSRDVVYEIMKGDKKNDSDKINFSLLRAIGDPVVNQHASPDDILEALDFCLPVNRK